MNKLHADDAAWAMRHAWLVGCDPATELRQARDEGRDLPVALERRLRRLARDARTGAPTVRWIEACRRALDDVQALPLRRDHPYDEPDAYDTIRSVRPGGPRVSAWRGTRRDYTARVHGGLLGRMAGCMLGKPVECWPRESIRVAGEETRNWPLRDYLARPTAAQTRRIAARKPRHALPAAGSPLLRPDLCRCESDDDIHYTVTGFDILARHGADFTPEDVASYWLSRIPLLDTCTAERVAYRNLAAGIAPPRSARVCNPYREWIGAQIRADPFGYAAPGDPARAAAWAWRDACISHVGNGIYGEMWVAAMIAAAFTTPDVHRVIQAGLAQIPAHCRLREDVLAVVAAHADGVTFDDLVDRVHGRWDEGVAHHWCHTNSNAQVVTAALLYGGEDFSDVIGKAVGAGFDTDCNGATCGSVWGVMHGVNALPTHWTEPLRNRVVTHVRGFHDVAIDALARDMADLGWRLHGGAAG